MTPRIVTIASIVEGHGEVFALPKLLHRLAAELPTVDLRTPRRPWRCPRGSLTAPNGIERGRVEAALTSAFDISQARKHSPSFDKFCRELQELLSPRAS